MNTMIVGFLAELGGTAFEIRHCHPVVNTEHGVAVVGTLDRRSDSRLLPAKEDGPGIFMLPPEAHAPFDDRPDDGDGAQAVILVGPELARTLTDHYPRGRLTRMIAGWPTVTDDGHAGAVARTNEFIGLRRAATTDLRALMLEHAHSHSEAAKPLYDAFEAVAPEENLAYVAGLGAYYRLAGEKRFDGQLIKRAQKLGVSPERLEAEITQLIKMPRPADSAAIGLETRSAAEQAVEILRRLGIRRLPSPQQVHSAPLTSDVESNDVPVSELTIGALDDLVHQGGYRLALGTVTIEHGLPHNAFKSLTPIRPFRIHDMSAAWRTSPLDSGMRQTRPAGARTIRFVVDPLQIVDDEHESFDDWSYSDPTNLSGATK